MLLIICNYKRLIEEIKDVNLLKCFPFGPGERKGKKGEAIKQIVCSALIFPLHRKSALILHRNIKDHVVAHCASNCFPWEGGRWAKPAGI